MKTWKHFTINELIESETANKLKIKNIPDNDIKENLNLLVENVLDPLREWCGCPIRVCSGYRCEELNRMVGGVKNSQHLKGEAADIQPIGIKFDVFVYKIKKWCANNIFDQCIIEKSDKSKWVHISYSRTKNRRQLFNLNL